MISYFLMSVLAAFLPASLLLALNWSVRRLPAPRVLALVSLAAVGTGFIGGRLAPSGQGFLLAAALVHIVLLVVFLLLQTPSDAHGAIFWQAIILASAAFRWGGDRNLTAVSAAHVVNTELILNMSAIAAGFGLVALLAVCGARLFRMSGAFRLPLMVTIALLMLVAPSGETVLAAMKLELIELSETPLGYAARTADFVATEVFLTLAALAAAAAWNGWRVLAPAAKACKTDDPIARRKAVAAFRGVRRLAVLLSFLIVAATAVQGYWQEVASQPPRLAPSASVTLASDNAVHLPLVPFRDGDMHRYQWIADDGKVIRFFVLNRFSNRLSLAVVFDSCMLCGDKGYILKDGEVLCIACGVHLFLSSVGNPGGCNPIPIKDWSVTESELIIPKSSLEPGQNYFNAMIDKEVEDPVNRRRIKSSKAVHTYQYQEKTYFFSSQESYDAFMAAPEQYKGN